MNRIDLLNSIKAVAIEETKDILLPTSIQRDNETQEMRAAKNHLMRLPDSKSYQKKAPYIIHQLVTGKDSQAAGSEPKASAIVRSVFCVYNDNEEEGELSLLNLIERLRIRFLKEVVFDGRYQLDLEAGLEMLIYPDDTAPYFGGEMISTWKLPAIKREVKL